MDGDRKQRLPDPNSLEHLMTYLPKHPDCKACQIANLKASHARRAAQERKDAVTEFGQEVTADTFVSKAKKDKSMWGSRYGIVFYDERTGLNQPECDANRYTRATKKAFRNFVDPKNNIESFYCDSAGELSG